MFVCVTEAAENNKQEEGYNPWPGYTFTGALRPFPKSEKRPVPDTIKRPDYAGKLVGFVFQRSTFIRLFYRPSPW